MNNPHGILKGPIPNDFTESHHSIEPGVQSFYMLSKKLDFGFARNDEKPDHQTFL
jgi:hypothetical protein